MKRIIVTILLTVSVGVTAFPQGTIYLYDQQSSTDETPRPGAGGAIQDVPLPWGQSFTPSFSSIGFIRLLLDDGNVNDGLGATVYVNLRSGSIGGAIIGTTESVTMGNNFAGTATFAFANEVSLTAGTVYYFEPVVQSGGTWNVVSGPYNYPGGSAFSGGLAAPGSDLWFREGIVVPEPYPSLLMLIMLGAGTFVLIDRRGKPFQDERP